jgi:hypothetical protein
LPLVIISNTKIRDSALETGKIDSIDPKGKTTHKGKARQITVEYFGRLAVALAGARRLNLHMTNEGIVSRDLPTTTALNYFFLLPRQMLDTS